MKKIIMFCLCLCLFTLTACATSKAVPVLTDEDIKTYTSEMATEPLSGDITLNGVKYSLPVKAQSLVDNGWKYNDYEDKGKPLENGYYVEHLYMDDGFKSEERRIEVTLYNTSGSTVDSENAMLGTIIINKKNDSYQNTVVLPKGITLKSTYEDVIKAYGAPTFDSIDNTILNSVRYLVTDMGKYGQDLNIAFDKDTKVINKIELKNIPK